MSGLPVQRRTTSSSGTAPGGGHSSPVVQLSASVLSSLRQLLRKPHAFPLLLFAFLLLTFVAFKLQRSSSVSSSSSSSSSSSYSRFFEYEEDGGSREAANLVGFRSGSPPIAKDKRGWLLDPVSLALESGIKGGAGECVSLHVGEIRPGGMRGNHRHHDANETFVIWGARTLFRLENNNIAGKAYGQAIVRADEVAVAASPSGTAHALVNVDPIRSTFFLGCQDSVVNYNSSDFNVWKDL